MWSLLQTNNSNMLFLTLSCISPQDYNLRYNPIDTIKMLLRIITSGIVSIMEVLLNRFLSKVPLRLIRRSFDYPHSVGPKFKIFHVFRLDIKRYSWTTYSWIPN